jgi:predicted transcriptional regulator
LSKNIKDGNILASNMIAKSKKIKKGEAAKKMIEIIKNQPLNSKDLAERCETSRRTINYNLKKFIEWGIFKKLEDDRYCGLHPKKWTVR